MSLQHTLDIKQLMISRNVFQIWAFLLSELWSRDRQTRGQTWGLDWRGTQVIHLKSESKQINYPTTSEWVSDCNERKITSEICLISFRQQRDKRETNLMLFLPSKGLSNVSNSVKICQDIALDINSNISKQILLKTRDLSRYLHSFNSCILLLFGHTWTI